MLPYLSDGIFGTGKVAWLTNFWDRHIQVLEDRLFVHGQKFLIGTERPTIADFKLFAPVSLVTTINPATAIPRDILEQVMSKIEANPYYFRWVEMMTKELAAYIK